MSVTVSVIIPIYNVQDFLYDSLNSVANQTFQDFEVIMVDDGSTDSSGEIALSFSNSNTKFKYVKTKNNGQSSARNIGLKLAKGKFVAYLDPDDSWQTTFLEFILNQFNNDCDIVSYLFPGEKKQKGEKIEEINQDEFINQMYSGRVGTVVWNKVFRKSLLNGVLFPEGQIHEEISFFNQFVFNINKIKVIPFCLYNYRKHRKGNSSESFSINDGKTIDQLEFLIVKCKETGKNKALNMVVLYTLVFIKDFVDMAMKRRICNNVTNNILKKFDYICIHYITMVNFVTHPKLLIRLLWWRSLGNSKKREEG